MHIKDRTTEKSEISAFRKHVFNIQNSKALPGAEPP